MTPAFLLSTFPQVLLPRLDPRRPITARRGAFSPPARVVVVGKAALALASAIEETAAVGTRGFLLGPAHPTDAMIAPARPLPWRGAHPGDSPSTAGSQAARHTSEPARAGIEDQPPDQGILARLARAGWQVHRGDHPLPGPHTWQATAQLIAFLTDLPATVPVVIVMSGGASALLAAPAPGLSQTDKRAAHAALIGSGRPITDLNVVRRHLSAVKGGGLLRPLVQRHSPVLVLALSDVPGNQPHDIGSGPFCPDPTTFADALEVASSLAGFPPRALEILQEGVAGHRPETLKPDEVPAGLWTFELLGRPDDALTEAAALLEAQGQAANRLPWPLAGSPAVWANRFVDAASRQAVPVGVWHLAAGETEVNLPPQGPIGAGGRASTLAVTLGLALAEAGHRFDLGVLATDGRDGSSTQAGGWLTTDDLAAPDHRRAAREALGRFDTATFLAERGRAWPGRPSPTNLGDLLLIRLS